MFSQVSYQKWHRTKKCQLDRARARIFSVINVVSAIDDVRCGDEQHRTQENRATLQSGLTIDDFYGGVESVNEVD